MSAADWSFIKCFLFFKLFVVLENTYLEQMAENGFTSFCILETNPFLKKMFTLNLVDGLHLYSKD